MAYSGLQRGIFDLHSDPPEELDLVERALTAVHLLRRSSEDCERDIHGWLATAFVKTVTSFWLYSPEAPDCVFSWHEDLGTPLTSISHQVPSTVMKSISAWFSGTKSRMVCVPAILQSSESTAEMRAACIAGIVCSDASIPAC